ncbi:hypothetical protein BT96DRAFT_996700 [Gymnopus androsaceus JB14]|uniref:RING-type domain-containing protein n=1 Tax=Gymnopus androsaceus JB14 TaxID=1447944 RepID=A0A6A4HHU4_9AGAR|nr:hypothetical protein BT96DRAFT_996700 [Gymnopus androsaceus JB14]
MNLASIQKHDVLLGERFRQTVVDGNWFSSSFVTHLYSRLELEDMRRPQGPTGLIKRQTEFSATEMLSKTTSQANIPTFSSIRTVLYVERVLKPSNYAIKWHATGCTRSKRQRANRMSSEWQDDGESEPKHTTPSMYTSVDERNNNLDSATGCTGNKCQHRMSRDDSESEQKPTTPSIDTSVNERNNNLDSATDCTSDKRKYDDRISQDDSESEPKPTMLSVNTSFNEMNNNLDSATNCTGNKRQHNDRMSQDDSELEPKPTALSINTSFNERNNNLDSLSSPSGSSESIWSSYLFPDLSKSAAAVVDSEKFVAAKAKWNGGPEENNNSHSVPFTSVGGAKPENRLVDKSRPFWPLDPPSPPAGQLLSPDVDSPDMSPLPLISPTPSTPVSRSTIAAAETIYTPWPQWRSAVEKKTSSSLPRISTSIPSIDCTAIGSTISLLDRDVVRYGFENLLATQVPNISPLAPMNRVMNTSAGSLLGMDDCQSRQQNHSRQNVVTKRSSGSSLNSAVSEVSTKVASPSFHCRLCLSDPCADITATICGHIFCSSCITESVLISPRCPVCKSAILLYCLFKLDLSS